MAYLIKNNVGGIIAFLQMDKWYLSLVGEEQKKLQDYSGQGDKLIQGQISYSSQSQKHFFWTTATNAIFHKDYDFAIKLAEIGLTAVGSQVDQHFIYNTFIQAYEKLNDYKRAKEYCLKEVSEFSKIGVALKKDFNGTLPPSLPCRDTLIHIVVDIEKDFEEAEHLFKLFGKNGLLTQEEVQDELENLKIDMLYSEAYTLLESNEVEKAKSVFDSIIQLDDSQEADIYKELGNYFLEQERQGEASEYFQKAVKANPLISGVKRKLEKLSKQLGTKVVSNVKDTLTALQEKETYVIEWWAKRDLANEYIKIKEYEHAWQLFNEAIQLRTKVGQPCDTIYPHMAKLLERQKRYQEALRYYLLAHLELLNAGGNQSANYVAQGIDRCLKKLDINTITSPDLLGAVKKEMNAENVSNTLHKLLQI